MEDVRSARRHQPIVSPGCDTMRTMTFDALGITVSDMAKTLDFYRLLGLTFPEGSEDEGHVEAVVAGGIRIMFDTEAVMRSFDDSWTAPQGRGRIGLAFLCEDAAAVDAAHAAVVAAGHRSHLDPFDAPWGQRYASVLDPDGTVVDLFAPQPE